MPITYPAYCRHCEQKYKVSITGHRRISIMKTQCQRCGDVKRTPLFRWFAGAAFFTFAFGVAGYLLYSSLSVLWPLFLMPFIDPDTGQITFALLMIPGYWAYAWVTGKLIK